MIIFFEQTTKKVNSHNAPKVYFLFIFIFFHSEMNLLVGLRCQKGVLSGVLTLSERYEV